MNDSYIKDHLQGFITRQIKKIYYKMELTYYKLKIKIKSYLYIPIYFLLFLSFQSAKQTSKTKKFCVRVKMLVMPYGKTF